MQEKIHWITHLRGIACLMVVMIHSTTWYITHPHAISLLEWDLANILNSASRVSVPLFFMISGYLFFGERSAQPRHFLRIALTEGIAVTAELFLGHIGDGAGNGRPRARQNTDKKAHHR